MSRSKIVLWMSCVLTNAVLVFAQPPGGPGGPGPGPRAPQTPPTGAPLPGLTAAELATFQAGLARFITTDSVTGTEPGTGGGGLGPRFNSNSCLSCHARPAPGGSSPAVNPQIAVATEYGAQNSIPPFLQSNGPVRVARFVRNADGTPDGGVHDLFVISGRADAGGCTIAQPNFGEAIAQNNVIFRIPTPTFGAGLIEAIPDSVILANEAANASVKAALGISGHENRSANDGTITRFGWKAQTRSLQIFSGEAYNVEIGVTNELFGSERDTTPGCQFNSLPEDATNFTAATPVAALSDVSAFSEFMRWLAPPQPQASLAGDSSTRGQGVFTQIGCALCHTPVLSTGPNTSNALSNRNVPLFSDLLVHHMGSGLADGITQGNAVGDEFRSAPLWGLSQRLFFLHDGRASDLTQAILAHAGAGSEANTVIANFNSLPQQAIEDLLNFLKSL